MKAQPLSGGREAAAALASFLAVAAFAVGIALAAPAGKQKSIFDDDGSDPPMTRPFTPPPVPVAPPPPPPPPIAPPTKTDPSPRATPPTPATPAPKAPAAPAPVARRGIPPAADLARSRAVLKEAFAAQLADASPAARGQLSRALLDEAAKAARDPADQYALFGGAINAAKEAASLRQVLRAAQAVAAVFEVDARAIVASAAAGMSLRGDTPARTLDNVLVGLDAVDDRVAAGELEAAVRLTAALRAPAGTDKGLAALVNRRSAEVVALRLARDRMAPAMAKLKSIPDDPAANAAVGGYHCFATGDWAGGLPLLAKGSEADLKQAAAAELAGPGSPADWLALGDKWWAAADARPGTSQPAIRQHAVDCYAYAKRDVSPLQQIKIDKRTAEVAAKVVGPSLAEFRAQAAVQRLTEFRRAVWAKVGDRRTPLSTADPIKGEVAWPAVAGGAYTVDGELMVGWNDGNHGKKLPSTKGAVRAAAGVVLDGGSVAVTNGVLDLQGEPDKPIYVRNVKFVVELGGTLKARNTVFENCSFAKGGAWFAVYSAKFELADCLFAQSKFEHVSIVDYGLRVNRCTFVDSSFGDRQNKPGKETDSAANARTEWSQVVDDDFYNTDFSASAVWMLQRCNLYRCAVRPTPATFASPRDLPVELGLAREERAKFVGGLEAQTTASKEGRPVYSTAPAFFANQAFPPP